MVYIIYKKYNHGPDFEIMTRTESFEEYAVYLAGLLVSNSEVRNFEVRVVRREDSREVYVS